MKKIVSLLIISTFFMLNLNFVANASNLQNTMVTEHLNLSKKVAKKAPTDIVMTTDTLKTVIEYNIIEATFAQNFSTRNAKVGDRVGFMLNNGLSTKEGTQILAPGSKIIAEVTSVTRPKSFNRSGKVTLQFTDIQLPTGEEIPLRAKVFSKKDYLSRGKLNALGKGLGTTLGMGAIGVGAGCGIGVAASAVIIGGFAIGLPVGIAAGALIGLVTPGLHYKAKAGDKILLQLTDNLEVIR